ncbi:MAG: Nif3-like dinuclear metal center hexameric protein [Candidatus Dojkabacteria bacterium]|nr:Nif3-like dinuclear metal center hexameric protein [Candidatus Dojkabacteria bacterium]
MIYLKDLNKYLSDYLNYDKKISVRSMDEQNGNGLQVKGEKKIMKIGFGVSASLELFKHAKKAGCQCLIVHHGLRMPDSPHYDSIFQNRIEYLLKNSMSLFGYHYLLDSHPVVGNNAQILKKLNITIKGQLVDWGWYGELETSTNLSDIKKKCEEMFGQDIILYKYGKDKVKKIGAVSGSGSLSGSEFQSVIDLDLDLYITGNPSESTREKYREIGSNFIAGGHYATETFGVKALMKKIRNKFGGSVETEYLELWNEV